MSDHSLAPFRFVPERGLRRTQGRRYGVIGNLDPRIRKRTARKVVHP